MVVVAFDGGLTRDALALADGAVVAGVCAALCDWAAGDGLVCAVADGVLAALCDPAASDGLVGPVLCPPLCLLDGDISSLAAKTRSADPTSDADSSALCDPGGDGILIGVLGVLPWNKARTGGPDALEIAADVVPAACDGLSKGDRAAADGPASAANCLACLELPSAAADCLACMEDPAAAVEGPAAADESPAADGPAWLDDPAAEDGPALDASTWVSVIAAR